MAAAKEFAVNNFNRDENESPDLDDIENTDESVCIFENYQAFKEKLNSCKDKIISNCMIKKCASKLNSSSKVWDHFGSLYFKNKLIFEKSIFCMECLQPSDSSKEQCVKR